MRRLSERSLNRKLLNIKMKLLIKSNKTLMEWAFPNIRTGLKKVLLRFPEIRMDVEGVGLLVQLLL